jgi:FkbM family methyltransferase
MAFLHRTRLFVNDLLSPFGFAINRVEKQPSECFGSIAGIRERAQLYETSTGRYYLPTDAPQDCVINCIKSGGVYEPEVVETAKAYIRPGSTVLDIGANFGQMSVLFSRFVGDGGQVHSFEADPFVYELLQKTLAANNCQNVTPHLGAVYDRPNQELVYPVQDFKRFVHYGAYGIDPNATAGRTVKTLTIDGLNISTPISLMKVDIQGSDLFALRGAVETIKRHRMPIIFEFEQQFQAEFRTSFQDYVDFVNSISYRFERLVMDINYLIVPR